MTSLMPIGGVGQILSPSGITPVLEGSGLLDGMGRVIFWTASDAVYVGGAGMSPGSSIVNSNGSTAGFLLQTSETYELDFAYVATDSGDQGLYATTTGDSALIYVLVQHVMAGGR